MPDEALWTVLCSTAASGVILLLIWGPRRAAGGPAAPRPSGSLRSLGTAFGLAAGYAAGHSALQGWPSLPPPQADGWLAWLAAAGLAAAAVRAAARRGDRRVAWLPWVLGAALSPAAAWVLLRPLAASSWSPMASAAWILGLGAAIGLLWGAVEAMARARSGPLLPVLLAISACGSCAALLLSGSLRLALLAAALAGAAGSAALVGWLRPGLSLRGGSAGIAVLLLAGLWINGRFYSDLPGSSALLLGASLPLVATVRLALGSRAGSRVPASIEVILVAAANGLAVMAALAAGPGWDE